MRRREEAVRPNMSWRDCLCCCNKSRILQDPGFQSGAKGGPAPAGKTERAETIDGDTLHRKFTSAVDKLQISNANLMKENEELKAEVKALKEAANREMLLGRNSISRDAPTTSTGGIISRRKNTQAMVFEEGDEDEVDSDGEEKGSR